MSWSRVLSKAVGARTVSRKVLLVGRPNVPTTQTSRALSSALAESYYNQEQKELMETAKKLIEAEINPVSKRSNMVECYS